MYQVLILNYSPLHIPCMILTDSDQHPCRCLFILHQFEWCLSNPSSVILDNPRTDSVDRPKFQSLCHILAKTDCKSFGHIFCRCHRICNRKYALRRNIPTLDLSTNQDVSPVRWSFLIRGTARSSTGLFCALYCFFLLLI